MLDGLTQKTRPYQRAHVMADEALRYGLIIGELLVGNQSARRCRSADAEHQCNICRQSRARQSRNTLARVAIRNSFAPSLLGNPLRILKPSRSHSPENAASNVRQVGNATCLHICYGSGI
jgi:hypothetical protein